MKFQKILTSALAFGLLAGTGAAAQAQGTPAGRGDDVLLEMNQAFKRGDRARLAALLPMAQGHALEPWAAYWELRARIDSAQPEEIEAFFARWSGTYQEDRLRNDWLRILGQRRDWQRFADAYPLFRMNDDREVRCYAIVVERLRGTGPLPAATVDEVRRNWYGMRESDDGCTLAAAELFAARQFTADDVWRKARLAIDANRPRVARAAVEIVAPEESALVAQIGDNPARFLASKATAGSRTRKELVTLALLKMNASDPDAAAQQLDSKWSVQMRPEERNWVWGAIGRQAASRLSPTALEYFAKVTRDTDLHGEMLAWKARAALRAGNWKEVLSAITAMDDALRVDSAWVYWRAKALLAGGPLGTAPAPTAAVQPESASLPAATAAAGRVSDRQRAEARQLLEGIASPRGFYEQLALEELGQRIAMPERPAPPTTQEREAARTNPSLARGLYAILLGLRSEGVREWNYATNLHATGGMGDRELLAAADMACQSEIWDRCINTSERTRSVFDTGQRFPMPHQSGVVMRSRQIGLDPAYVYGLIRQESRFITDARSGVGASGLMQVMPATARWTANKIGMGGFRPEQINDRDTNIAIGTAYLKLALDDFQGSMPLAAAAYNAGPGRPRSWRNGPVVDAAIWAENVPFAETRDYVKKVLANTTSYAAILSGQPQSLRARLGTVGPKDPNFVEPNKDLP
ncbi:lytic transglycosylase domain-containing protein [Xylophilus ampelinus]|uniref:Soluble lytic murein transglycosylase n=1 Tax=Xylophilus ampelinus TaxID=54067 RepID=A0A318SNK8_9BURK|nr:lytic transglycosylase domain-containing protein [Xylophilus ampelinus]MCS4509601.1 lytic transglycosylase domain-containing protein [Xylophilus ampelinus]PYE78915.1 soluble lytic murein transglycosylase [Xylophilus ampelinus]